MANDLEYKLNRISQIFNVNEIDELLIDSTYIQRYYAINKIPYSIFHSLGNSVHMGITRDGVFKPEDLLEQARVVSQYIDSSQARCVLELGAGRGANSIWLAQRHQDTEFTALDFSDVQISIAKKSGKRLANFKAVIGDFHDLESFGKSHFDIAFATECVCHSDNVQKVLAEAYAALKPGGYLIIFDGYRERPETELSDNEKVAAMLVERGMAVTRFQQYQDFSREALEVGFNLVFEENLSEFVIPTMERFERLAGIYFRHRRPARFVAKLLPAKFTYNAISGFLMPTLMRNRTFSYWCTIHQKPN